MDIHRISCGDYTGFAAITKQLPHKMRRMAAESPQEAAL
jgi:hypothetical protein